MNNRLPLFYAVTVILWSSLYFYMPYVTPFAEQMEADVRLIGIIAGSYGFWQMTLRFPLGIYADLLQKRKIFIVLGMFFSGLAGLIVYVFPNPISLLAGRSFAGVAATVWVAFTILAASYYRREESVKAVGHMNAAFSIGRIVSLLIGGFIAEGLGFNYAFLVAAVVGFTGFALSFAIVERPPEGTKKDPPKLSELLAVTKNRQLLCAATLATFSQYIFFATTFGFTPLIAYQMGASNIQLSWLGIVATVPGLLVSPNVSAVAKRFGVSLTLAVGFVLTGLGSVLIAYSSSLELLFVLQFMGSIGNFTVFTLVMGLSIRDISAEHRATAMGFHQAVYGLGIFLGPAVMGWLVYGVGMGSSFVITGGLGLLAAVLSVIFVNRGYLRY